MTPELQKEFNDVDEASIDFSVDPDMLAKLDIKKAKAGEENAFDDDKIYRFQLAKDIQKLESVRGTFKSRHARYMEVREKDPDYQTIAFPEMRGTGGEFRELLPLTVEQSWKSTSQPYGNIAHKRYIEYLRNLPKGPTEAEIRDKQQREMDMELWDKIKSGKTEKTKKELRAIKHARHKKQMKEIADSQKIEYLEERKRKMLIIKHEKFDALRKKPTKREFHRSLENWHKGVHYPYDFDKGFPIATEVGALGMKVIKHHNPHERMRPEVQYKSDQYIKDNNGAEKFYIQHMVDINFKKAQEHLRQKRLQAEEERKRLERETAAAVLAQRRGGTMSGHNMQQQAVAAKFAILQKERQLANPDSDLIADHDSDSDDESSSSGSSSSEGRVSPDSRIGHSSATDGFSAVPGVKISASEHGAAPIRSSARSWGFATWFSASSKLGAAGASRTSNKEDNELGRQTYTNTHVVATEEQNRADTDELTHELTMNASGSGAHWRNKPPAEVRRVRNSEYKKKEIITPTQRRLRHIARQFAYVRPDRIAHHVLKEIRYWRRARKHIYYAKPGEMTPGERYKHQQKKLLKAVSERISSKAYHDALVNLEEHLIPTAEFMKQVKRTRRSLKREITAKERTARSADDWRYIELLKKRLAANEVRGSERLRREDVAKQRAERILKYIDESQQLLDSLQDGFIERVLKRIRKMRMSRAAKRAMHKKQQAEKKHMLPAIDLQQNSTMVDELRKARFVEKENEEYWQKVYYRALGVDPYDRIKTPTLEDLLLAVRAGNYVEVLDCVFHLTHPVGANDVSDDGFTATYTALMMILKREVLDSTADFEDLMAGPLERVARYIGLRQESNSVDGNMELVLRILIACGGDINYRKYEQGQDGLAIMHNASESGAVDVMQWLISMGTPVDLRTSKQNRTPLMIALEFDQQDAVFFLLRNGAMLNLELKDSDGWTALHYAATYARADLVLFLLVCGARVNSRNNNGRLASEEAQSRGRTEIMGMILSFKSDSVDYIDRLENLFESEQQQYDEYQEQNKKHMAQALSMTIGLSEDDADEAKIEEGTAQHIDLMEDDISQLPPKVANMFSALTEYQQRERLHQEHQRKQLHASQRSGGSSRSAGTFALLSGKLLNLNRAPPSAKVYQDPWEMGDTELPRQQTDENGIPLYQRSLQMKRISFYQPPRLMFNRKTSAKVASEKIYGNTTALEAALKERRGKSGKIKKG